MIKRLFTWLLVHGTTEAWKRRTFGDHYVYYPAGLTADWWTKWREGIALKKASCAQVHNLLGFCPYKSMMGCAVCLIDSMMETGMFVDRDAFVQHTLKGELK